MAGEIGNDGTFMTREEPHNFLDKAASYRDLFPVNPLYKDFSLAMTQVHPFSGAEQLNTRLMFCMAAGYGLGRCFLEGDANTATVDKGLVVAIGEVLAPGLPDDLRLPLGRARSKLINVVRRFMQSPQTFMFFGIPTENFCQRYAVKYRIEPVYHKPVGSPEWAEVGMERGPAMKILAAIGDAIGTQTPTIPQKMLVVMLVATLKKGSMTDPFVQKIMLGLRTELGLDIQINPELVKDVARAYGSYVNSRIVRGIVNDWKEWIPEGALRLRLTVNQAVWEGLTGFNTIKRTIQSLPHFPWGELAAIPLYASEMEAVVRADGLINDDEYYGFNRDLGPAGIRNYRNLASVCAAIQHRALGDDQIQRAQCFTQNYAYSDRVNRVIADFVNNANPDENVNNAARVFIETLSRNRREE